MKGNQKLIFLVESLKFVQRFDEIDPALIPVVQKLEREGDQYGPAGMVMFLPSEMYVSVTYADKRRGPVKETIFGYDADEFMSRQFK